MQNYIYRTRITTVSNFQVIKPQLKSCMCVHVYYMCTYLHSSDVSSIPRLLDQNGTPSGCPFSNKASEQNSSCILNFDVPSAMLIMNNQWLPHIKL